MIMGIIMMNMLIMMTMIINKDEHHTLHLHLGYEHGDEHSDQIHHSLHPCYEPGDDHDNHIHHTLYLGYEHDDHDGNDYHGHHDHP